MLGCVIGRCVFGPCEPGLGQRGSVSSDHHDTTRDVVCDFYFDSSGQPDSTPTAGRDYPSEIAIFQRGSVQKPHDKVEQAPFPQYPKPKSIFMIAASSPKVQVIASDGAQPGDLVRFDYNGVEYDVVVPDGVFAGMRFMADVSPPSNNPASVSNTVATVSAAVVCVKVWVKSVTLSAAVVISCAPRIVQRLAKRCRRSRRAFAQEF
jgi:hypothetical protein